MAGYTALRERAPALRLIADWRLLGLEPEEIAGWIKGEHACPAASGVPPRPAEPMPALLLQAVLDSLPELLDAYLDLELQAELAQTPADHSYGTWTRSNQEVDSLLEAWWSQRESEQQQQARLTAQAEELKQRGEAVAAAQA